MKDKERCFAEEWMCDHNAYQAALRAGYSAATARKAAAWIHPDHPEKPELRKYIDQLLAQQSRRLGVTSDRVVNEMAKVAFVNPADVIDFETGKVRADAKREDLAAIAKVRVKKGDFAEYEVSFADKGRHLEMLGKMQGLFETKIKIDGEGPVIVDDV